MGYRPPSAEPRGIWAKAIHRKRRELDVSQQRVFEMLGERLGFSPKSRAAYVALDMGTRQPTPAEQAILADWLGEYPSESEAPPAGDTPLGGAALLEALAAQTAAISSLVEELRSSRQEQADHEVRLRALEAELRSLRAQPTGGGSPGRSAPRVKAES